MISSLIKNNKQIKTSQPFPVSCVTAYLQHISFMQHFFYLYPVHGQDKDIRELACSFCKCQKARKEANPLDNGIVIQEDLNKF